MSLKFKDNDGNVKTILTDDSEKLKNLITKEQFNNELKGLKDNYDDYAESPTLDTFKAEFNKINKNYNIATIPVIPA